MSLQKLDDEKIKDAVEELKKFIKDKITNTDVIFGLYVFEQLPNEQIAALILSNRKKEIFNELIEDYFYSLTQND